jgi:phospholipid/cholesterol/gamma-HCH transport system substrate-binding protein
LRLPGGRATLAKVVVFTVASFILTVGLAMKIGNFGFFNDRYTLEAEFKNASGVFPGDAVKLAGVDVGRVSETRIEDGKAIVTFDIDREIVLTDQARVGIRWRNVIGLRFLYVYPGPGGQPVEDGDRFTLAQTDEAGDIGEFLNHLGPILKAIDPEKANAFLRAMNTALSGGELAVRGLITEGSVLARALGDMDEEIKSVISSSDEIMAAYASQDDNIGRIIDDLDVVTANLAGMTDEVNSLLVNLAVVQQELERLLVENRGNIDATLSNLLVLTRTLAGQEKQLEETLCSLPSGVLPYDQTSSWGEWFNVRIVKLVFKDDQGNIISSQEEGPDSRPARGPDFTVCRGGRPVKVQPATNGSGGSGAQETASEPHPVGLEPFVETVIGEEA